MTENPGVTPRSIFQSNVATLAAHMRKHSVTKIAITYSGGGDEGGLEETEYEPAVEKDSSFLAEEIALASIWLSEPASAFEPLSIEDAAEQLVDDALALSGHDGYHNNEGGGGTLYIHADGTARLEHYDNIIEQEYDYEEFDAAAQVIA